MVGTNINYRAKHPKLRVPQVSNQITLGVHIKVSVRVNVSEFTHKYHKWECVSECVFTRASVLSVQRLFWSSLSGLPILPCAESFAAFLFSHSFSFSVED